jgi:AraC-like DNA-binding protein
MFQPSQAPLSPSPTGPYGLLLSPSSMHEMLAAAGPEALKMLASACERELRKLEASKGVAGQVRELLHQLRDPGAGMKMVARALKITERTLRRRLAQEGTSFSEIANEVKYSVARQYLEGSRASVDEIAELAGFSDAANFRRAFIRWTHMSPAQFRSRQQRDGA